MPLPDNLDHPIGAQLLLLTGGVARAMAANFSSHRHIPAPGEVDRPKIGFPLDAGFEALRQKIDMMAFKGARTATPESSSSQR
jgi:hypothetical protein